MPLMTITLSGSNAASTSTHTTSSNIGLSRPNVGGIVGGTLGGMVVLAIALYLVYGTCKRSTSPSNNRQLSANLEVREARLDVVENISDDQANRRLEGDASIEQASGRLETRGEGAPPSGRLKKDTPGDLPGGRLRNQTSDSALKMNP
jgi:hypothetical protein